MADTVRGVITGVTIPVQVATTICRACQPVADRRQIDLGGVAATARYADLGAISCVHAGALCWPSRAQHRATRADASFATACASLPIGTLISICSARIWANRDIRVHTSFLKDVQLRAGAASSSVSLRTIDPRLQPRSATTNGRLR